MKTKYLVDIYTRVSREDGDKLESDSISNQKKLCMDFLNKHPNMTLHEIREDDGYSGVTFERPSFLRMIDDIKQKKVNCIIVKDLSRFGRNWLTAGKYIQQIFPYLGVRFIAINDGYDSLNSDADTEGLIMPIRNLINDTYAGDISQKIRSVFEVKRKNGDFVGPFAPYGYKKDPENRHRLIIDEEPKAVIRQIVTHLISGISPHRICKMFNDSGILSPMDYKRHCGEKYTTCFKENVKTLWNETTIIRIVTNEVYLGHLIQGKRGTTNYKDKVVKLRPEDEHVRVENTHEPIITQEEFNLIRKILFFDSRTSPNEAKTFIFSGILFCGDCKQNMIRHTVPRNGKKYIYYVCSSHKKDAKVCSTHNLSEIKLTKTVFESLKQQIAHIFELSEILEFIEGLPACEEHKKRLFAEIERKSKYIASVEAKKKGLYDDLCDGLITKEDFRNFNESYTKEVDTARNAVKKLEDELLSVDETDSRYAWIDKFKQYKNIESLDRQIILALVDKIYVYEDSRIEIIFNYSDEYAAAVEYISAYKDTSDEAVM